MVAERKIYEEQGVEKYVAHQVEHENEPLMPGVSFPFVKVGVALTASLLAKHVACPSMTDPVVRACTHQSHHLYMRLSHHLSVCYGKV